MKQKLDTRTPGEMKSLNYIVVKTEEERSCTQNAHTDHTHRDIYTHTREDLFMTEA